MNTLHKKQAKATLLIFYFNNIREENKSRIAYQHVLTQINLIGQGGIDFDNMTEGTSTKIANPIPVKIQISQCNIDFNCIREETRSRITNLVLTRIQISQYGIDFNSIRKISSTRITNIYPIITQIEISQCGIDLNSIREGASTNISNAVLTPADPN